MLRLLQISRQHREYGFDAVNTVARKRLLSSSRSTKTFFSSFTQSFLSLVLIIELLTLNLPQESRTYGYVGTKLSQEPYLMLGSSNEQYISNGTHTAQYLYDQTSLATMVSGIFNGLGIRTFQYIDNGNGNWIGNYVAAQNSLDQVTQANTYLYGITYDWTLSYDARGNLAKQSLETFANQTLT